MSLHSESADIVLIRFGSRGFETEVSRRGAQEQNIGQSCCFSRTPVGSSGWGLVIFLLCDVGAHVNTSPSLPGIANLREKSMTRDVIWSMCVAWPACIEFINRFLDPLDLAAGNRWFSRAVRT